jgi:hypothetical protein
LAWSARSAVGAALLAPASSSAELPPPPPPPQYYPYFALFSVSLEASGSYHEHYTNPGTGDEETVDFEFGLKREFTGIEWLSNMPAPTPGTEFAYLEQPGQEHLEASGSYEFVPGSGPLKGQAIHCAYFPKTSEPKPPLDDRNAGLLELIPAPEAALLGVRVSYPLGSSFVGRSGEEPCGEDSGVGTSGPANTDSGVQEAISHLRFFLVNGPGGSPETLTFSHPYSTDVDGDEVNLKDELTVKVEPQLLPPPIATPPKGPLEKLEPSTPITPPTTPPKPPVIQEPEVGANPPVITGGGGSPPKLHTGINAKCPKAGKPCTVTGVVEAELPAPRPARKADVSRKAKLRRVVLGKVSFPLAAGASKTVVITLSKAGAAFLGSHPGVRAKIAVTVSAPGATRASRTRTAKLRLPAARRHR